MGLQFGMKAIQTGKRIATGNNEPTLVANSTKARFTIAGIVSRTMGLVSGDYVQFISNIPSIDMAIAERDSEIIAWCEENGVELGTDAARAALIKEFGSYAICKGVPMYEKDGKRKMVGVRMTDEQKQVSFDMNKAAIAQAVGKDIDEVTIEDYNPVTEGFTGAKATSTSSLTGIGLPLGFSDINMWNELKEDLGDAAEDYNRIYKVNLNEPIECEVENGKEGEGSVTVVTAYPFTFESDEEPIRKNVKK